MDNQNNNPGDGGQGAPVGGQTPVQPEPAAAEEKCATCGNQAAGGNCVPCGQNQMSCTCPPASTDGGTPGDATGAGDAGQGGPSSAPIV